MSVGDKAVRLVETGKVRPLTAATVYVVDGDQDNYLVTLASYRGMCSCPAPSSCSHIDAARLYRQED